MPYLGPEDFLRKASVNPSEELCTLEGFDQFMLDFLKFPHPQRFNHLGVTLYPSSLTLAQRSELEALPRKDFASFKLEAEKLGWTIICLEEGPSPQIQAK